MTSNPEKSSTIELLESLITVTKKISDSLKFQLSSEQIDALAHEHRQVMAQIQTIPKDEMKSHQIVLENLNQLVQLVQKDLDNYHDAIKDKLITFGRKRKQIHAYNAMS